MNKYALNFTYNIFNDYLESKNAGTDEARKNFGLKRKINLKGETNIFKYVYIK